jgi:OOP family OmpA-OmpF porin
LLSNLAGLFSDKSKSDSLVALGTTLVSSLFGEKAGSIAGTIASLTGLKSSSSSNLLYMAAPLVFSFLKKFVTDKNLDAAGLVSALAEQTGFLKGKVNPQLASAMGLGSLFDSISGSGATASVSAASTSHSTSSSRPAAVPPVAVKEGSLLTKLLPWLIGLGALAAGLTMFRGCDKIKTPDVNAPVVTAPRVEAPPVVTPAAPATAAAPVAAILPAKIYYAVGSPTPEGPSAATLAQTAIAIKEQGIAVDITGYTDKTGDVAANDELAKKRALGVRDRLLAAGVAESKINMKPPFAITTTGSGADSEARRVEITAH